MAFGPRFSISLSPRRRPCLALVVGTGGHQRTNRNEVRVGFVTRTYDLKYIGMCALISFFCDFCGGAATLRCQTGEGLAHWANNVQNTLIGQKLIFRRQNRI